MKIRAKTVILGILGLLVLLVLGGITAIGWQIVLGPKARAVTDRKFDATDARLARGKYIVEGPASCFHCHSEHDVNDPGGRIIQSKKGAGWLMPVPELGTIASRNITPDPETGIGKWTDDEIARAIQEGVSRDGSALFPMMPYMNFAHMTDEDVASVVVYLRTIPPVKNVVPTRKLIFPLNILVNTMPQPLTTHAPDAPRTTAAARGEYLVRTVAGCGDCHTPSDDKGQPLPGMDFSGGNVFHDPMQKKDVAAPNITQDPSGIAHYDDELFAMTLHTGQVRGRQLSPVMPYENFRIMTDDDLRDAFAYLKTQPQVKHRVSNTDPPTKCPVCNQVHGLGELNKK
jgi:mono/diheme cytochrome c family protein